jgi:hypothetical protein
MDRYGKVSEEIRVYTSLICELVDQEVIEVKHKHFGNTSIFRWELVHKFPRYWIATLDLGYQEHHSLLGKSEREEKDYLAHKISEAISKASSD